MKKLVFLIKGLSISLSLFLCCMLVYADNVPKTLNIQGRVTTDSGQPLSGPYTVTLTIYDKTDTKINISPEITASGTLYGEGLYNQNLNISAFFTDGRTFNDEYKFDVKIVAKGYTITSDKTSFSTSPSAFYASTSTYSKILDPNQAEKLVSENFYATSIYKINVDTAVAISTATYTGGNSFVWGINSSGVQGWTNPDIQVSTATWAINLDTINKLSNNHFNPAIAYKINVDTAVAVSTATYTSGNSFVWGINSSGVQGWTNPDIQVSTATWAINLDTINKLSSNHFNPLMVYKINVDTSTYAGTAATANALNSSFKLVDGNFTAGHVYTSTASYAVNAGTAAYVAGTALADGSVTTNKIADLNVTTIKIQNSAITAIKIEADAVTPDKLQEGDGTLYSILVSTANALNSSFKLDDGNFSAGHVYTATATYATSAGTAATANALNSSFKLDDGNFTTGHVYTATATYATSAGTAATANALNSNFKLANGNFTTGQVYTATATYATSAGTANALNFKLTDANFTTFTEDPSYIYDIRVSSVDASGADLAEIYASSEILEPGDVVSISATKDNSIEKTKVADDTMVAGVISTEPGLLMNTKEKGYKLALVGKVPTKVCNESGNIKRGDMLVSSSIAGYAKKASDQPKTGTVIGKALENFDSSKGTILVLVNLQ